MKQSADNRTEPIFRCVCGRPGVVVTRAGAWCEIHARRPLAKAPPPFPPHNKPKKKGFK